MYIALKNPFRYRSYYYDFETGLYYLNSRYYDPEIGRFINIDDISIINESRSILNGLNLFIYCNDNPIMHTDTNGQSWWSDLWNKICNVWDVIVGGIVSVVFVAAGVALTIFTGGALYNLGATLIGAGVGGFIGGLTSKLNGGSFWGGYLGGAISGGLTGFLSSIGLPFIGGFVGNFAGTIITDSINGVNIDLNYILNLGAESLLSGIVSIGAWKFGEVTKLLNTPGFRDVFIGLTVWAEFASASIFNESKKIIQQIAQFFRKVLNL